MFRGRLRTLVTLTVVIEGSIAGWAVGAGWLGPLAMIALVTAADSVWGLARRGAVCDVAGVELAAALAVLLVAGADLALGALTAAACAAWLVRPERYAPVRRPGAARTTG
jgi:hypothetical protein